MPVKRHTGDEMKGKPVENSFRQFMTTLASDARLGAYARPLADQSAEVVVLHLVQALADCAEGRREHPAVDLLRRQEGGR
jgi:hypothetical protein